MPFNGPLKQVFLINHLLVTCFKWQWGRDKVGIKETDHYFPVVDRSGVCRNIRRCPRGHILGDNDGSIAMARNPQFHKRTKHVDIQWHWVCELVSNGLINIVNCRDPQQTADILTKQVPQPKFIRHVNKLGLSDLSLV